MRILVDADACPVKKIIVNIAKKLSIEVIMFFDTAHIYEDGYSKILLIDKGRDSVDLALINSLHSNDIVVTQDYGVATLSLAKQAYPLNQNGLIFTKENIDVFLMQRHLSAKNRRVGKHSKGPKKRTPENDFAFEKSLKQLIQAIST